MVDYIIEPKSRAELRRLAGILRKQLGLTNILYFPIVELLEIMGIIFPKFNYEIVGNYELPNNVHADTDIINHLIRIKEIVYNGAYIGNGRDRMTIAHEIGHYFTLCFCGFNFQRNFSQKEVPAYRQPEWQAKCFAAELLIPANLVSNMNYIQIMKYCGVSKDAAMYQYKILHNI